MTFDAFIAEIDHRGSPMPEAELEQFEAELGAALPGDYRQFLIACNGGHLGGRLWFFGPTPGGADPGAGLNHVYGLRPEAELSLRQYRAFHQSPDVRIPRDLLAIGDDAFANEWFIGLAGAARGRVYFWFPEDGPPPAAWSRDAGSAGGLSLMAESFTEFVARVRRGR